jgi:hypothetical protein
MKHRQCSAHGERATVKEILLLHLPRAMLAAQEILSSRRNYARLRRTSEHALYGAFAPEQAGLHGKEVDPASSREAEAVSED